MTTLLGYTLKFKPDTALRERAKTMAEHDTCGYGGCPKCPIQAFVSGEFKCLATNIDNSIQIRGDNLYGFSAAYKRTLLCKEYLLINQIVQEELDI